MKKTFFAAAVVAAFTFSACSENKTENTEAVMESTEAVETEATLTTNVVVETPDYTSGSEVVETQIEQVVDAYLKVKEALVASDAEAAKAAASNVASLAEAMPVATLTGEQKAYAEEKRAEIQQSASAIAQASDVDAQREHLELLSESVFSMAKAFGAATQQLYYQHCPMANNNQGAYWLSANEDIRNPYFGESMLKCGSTEEVYKN
ncbi:DUF3347 domain-containing protein [Pontibacter toksunensis]|uniref:DUF3347 domain-containing protein n=1 Tax=Pontibacter toksunensis TaxID=1332631 RepID=A0ABW6C1T5_9BACT